MTRLFMDIDGVLNRVDEKGKMVWRSDAPDFLRWAVNHFLVSFLTGWRDKNLIKDMCLSQLGCLDLVEKFDYPKWDMMKTDAINFKEPFYWLDDEVMKEEGAVLGENEAHHRLILVNPQAEDELQRLSRILAERERDDYGVEIPDLNGEISSGGGPEGAEIQATDKV